MFFYITFATIFLPTSLPRCCSVTCACLLFVRLVSARTDLCLWIGAFSIPRDDKRYRGGEDAWFLDASNNAFGVADGVSEWEDLAGINPQEYAQDLMQGTQEAIGKIQTEQRSRTKQTETEGTGGGIEADMQTGRQTCNPADVAKEALTRAYHKARNFGSSTAIVGVLDGESGIFGKLVNTRA